MIVDTLEMTGGLDLRCISSLVGQCLSLPRVSVDVANLMARGESHRGVCPNLQRRRHLVLRFLPFPYALFRIPDILGL